MIAIRLPNGTLLLLGKIIRIDGRHCQSGQSTSRREQTVPTVSEGLLRQRKELLEQSMITLRERIAKTKKTLSRVGGEQADRARRDLRALNVELNKMLKEWSCICDKLGPLPSAA